MAAENKTHQLSITAWLSRITEFESIICRLAEPSGDRLSAWTRTTSGVIALLLFLQAATGILLAFHYVPAVSSAYTTVAYIELVVRDGTWIRSVHYHSSVLLPIVLALHLLQMLVRGAYSINRTAWNFGLVMLALVLAAAATGYALPWDARAVNGVNIAASLAGNAPLIGSSMKTWLINDSAISTLTLSRFYGLHVFVVPVLISLVVVARLFIFRSNSGDQDRGQVWTWAREQFTRNAIVMGVAFFAISIFSRVYPAPFGPHPVESATYLPRPGPQFLWLFEMQKYTDGPLAAMLAFGFPALVICGLIALPLFVKHGVGPIRVAVSALFLIGFGIVGTLTATAIYQDASDSRISDQLAKQQLDEDAFRRSAFEPQTISLNGKSKVSEPSTEKPETSAVEIAAVSSVSIPAPYTTNCAKCHGKNGEGKAKNPSITDLTTREEDQLTPETILAIINDPSSMGRSSKMPSYKDKLSETEKQEIVSWLKNLSVPANSNADIPQTAKLEERKKQ